MSTVYTMSALEHLSDLQLRGLLSRARYDLDCSVAGSSSAAMRCSIWRTSAACSRSGARGPGRRGAEPRGSPALRKRSAGYGIPPTKPLVSSFFIRVRRTPT